MSENFVLGIYFTFTHPFFRFIYEKLNQEIQAKIDCANKLTQNESEKAKLQNNLDESETKINEINNLLQNATGKLLSHKESVKPKIEFESSPVDIKRGLIFKRIVNTIHHLKIKNIGYAPIYNIYGQTTYYPKNGGLPHSESINFNRLLPEQEEDVIVGDDNTNGAYEKIRINLICKDILGNQHNIDEEL